MSENVYRRDIPFDFELNERGDLKMKINEDAISQSIYTVLRTNHGDKPFVPRFGSNLEEMLFEGTIPLNFMALTIKNKIIESLNLFEPNVDIQNINVDWKDEDRNAIHIDVEYRVSTDLQVKTFSDDISVINKDSISLKGMTNV